MSTSYPRAAPPAASISLAVSRAPSALRSKTATLQPSPASVRQSCWPRLRAPPVTSATLPSRPRSIAPLFPLKRSGPLLHEGLDPLARVLGTDDLVEGACLDLDGLIDRRLDPVIDGLDDEPGCDRRPT